MWWSWWNFNQFCYWDNSAEVYTISDTHWHVFCSNTTLHFKCLIYGFVSLQPALPPDQDSVAGPMATSSRAKNWSSTWGRLKPRKANKCTALFDTTIKENSPTLHVSAVLISCNTMCSCLCQEETQSLMISCNNLFLVYADMASKMTLIFHTNILLKGGLRKLSSWPRTALTGCKLLEKPQVLKLFF